MKRVRALGFFRRLFLGVVFWLFLAPKKRLVTVPVQDRIAMSLHQLGSGGGLQTIGDLYEVHKSTLSIVVREFCRAVRKHLQPVFV